MTAPVILEALKVATLSMILLFMVVVILLVIGYSTRNNDND